jgi:hypothetical protein
VVDDGVVVDPEQIRAHAAHVGELAARFEAVKSASAHILQDESAYGLLCGWIAGILEGRHVRQDELIVQAEENLSLVVDGLRQTADDYEAMDAAAADSISAMQSELG